MKSKTKKNDQGIDSRLAAYGEAFMKMFDDYEEKDDNMHSASEGESGDSMSEEEPSDSSDSSSDEDDNDKPAKGSGEPSAEVEEVIFSMMTARKASNAAATASGQQAAQRAAGKATQAGGQVDAATLKLMRKKFMSSKAKDIFADVEVTATEEAAVKDDQDMGGLTPEEFQKLQQEVELYGAKGLDRKQQKKWKAQYLERLGARADKAPRIAGAIGRGLSQKRNEREQRAIEEAIESGMMQKKGMGKKRKAMQAKQRDKGLQEAGPSFRNGVLRVSKKFAPVDKPGGPNKRRKQRLPNF